VQLGKLRVRYRLLKRPNNLRLLPAAWLCNKCDKQLDEFGDRAHACKHLKEASVTPG